MSAHTEAIGRRVAELQGLLRESLTRDPAINLSSLKVTSAIAPLDLGGLAVPVPAPEWADFAPSQPGGLGRLLGGNRRYQAELVEAEREFATAEADCQAREAARQREVAAARASWSKSAARAKRQADEHNAHVDELAEGLRGHDRFAVSEYVQLVLDRSPYPAGFPTERHAGHVPESALLAVEWYLPTFDIVPEHKEFRHVKTRKAVEPIG